MFYKSFHHGLISPFYGFSENKILVENENERLSCFLLNGIGYTSSHKKWHMMIPIKTRRGHYLGNNASYESPFIDWLPVILCCIFHRSDLLDKHPPLR